jgi:hypothetical protein
MVEVPGLFGYSQEPADYLSFFFVAIAFSRLSIEEDYLRADMQRVKQAAAFSGSNRRGFRMSEKGIALS